LLQAANHFSKTGINRCNRLQDPAGYR
jgi:hypothetical protein